MTNGIESKIRRRDKISDPLRPTGILPDPAVVPGLDVFFPGSVASACECTGITPTIPEDETEAASYRDIYAIPSTGKEEGRRGEK